MFDWDDLRHLAALAEEGSLSAAARRLGVEHATVARRIAALEAATNSRLVDRRSGRYALTEAGRTVADHAQRMQAEAFAVERALSGASDALAAEVAVSAPPMIASALIAPRLAALRHVHPALCLRLLGEIRTVSLSRREADVALRLGRPEDASLIVRKAAAIRYALYASAKYLAGRDEAAYEFIAFDETLAQVPQQAILQQEAGDRPIVLRSNDLGLQRDAVRAHAGIAALPDFAARNAGLVQVGERSVMRDVSIAYHRDLRGNAAVAAVTQFLVDCLRRAPAPP